MTPPVSVEIDQDAELVAVLEHARRALFAHPIAAQAAFSALVAEGREFSKTREGAIWQERLLNSGMIEKAETIWEGVALNVLEDDETTVVPSLILDALVKLLHERAVDAVLTKLHTAAE